MNANKPTPWDRDVWIAQDRERLRARAAIVAHFERVISAAAAYEARVAHFESRALTPEEAEWALAGWQSHPYLTTGRSCLCAKCQPLRVKLDRLRLLSGSGE